MATMNENFFAELLSPKAAKWSAGVAFDRSNGLPLDQWSVFQTKTAAEEYLSNSKAYPGQVIAYAESDGSMTACVLSQNTDGTALTLKQIGIIPSGDAKTIEVTAAGVISLLGASTAANGTLPMIDTETGKLVWKTLEDIGAGDGNDNTTYTFELGENGTSFIVTPFFNGQPIYEGEGEEQVQVTKTISLDVYTKKEVDDAIDDAVKGILGEDVQEAYDTLKEIQDILEGTDGEKIDGLIETVDANKEAIDTLSGDVNTVGSVAKQIADAVNPLATKAELERVEGVANSKQTAEQVNTAITTALAGYTDNEALEELLDGKVDNADLANYYTKGEADGKYAVATEVARDYATKQEIADAGYAVAETVNDELAKKLEKVTIGHTSEGVAEGVTYSEDGKTANIVVDAYLKNQVYTKGETDTAITNKIKEFTGGESAADVLLALNDYKKANDTEIYGATKVAEWTDAEGKYNPDYTKDSRIDANDTAIKVNAKAINDIAVLVGTIGDGSEQTLAGKIGALEAHDAAHSVEFSTLSGKVDQNIVDIAKKADKETTYTKGEVDALLLPLASAESVYTKTEADGKFATKGEDAYDDTKLAGRVKAIEDDYLKGDHKTALEGLIAAEQQRAEGIEGGLRTRVEGIEKDYLKGADKTELTTVINGKVASVTAGDTSVTVGGTATAPTVAAKLSADADNALTLAADGLKVVIPAAAEYSIVKAANSGEYAAVYNLTKDGAVVGASINIPKDMVVKSGSVVGDEIVLILNDEDSTEIKIPVGSLIEYVTSGSATGDMVVVNVSDDHKVTATITDGKITLAKLTTEVQTAIGKAHTHENATVLAGISADKVAEWDAKADLSYVGKLPDGFQEMTVMEYIEATYASYGNIDGLQGEIARIDDEISGLNETIESNYNDLSETISHVDGYSSYMLEKVFGVWVNDEIVLPEGHDTLVDWINSKADATDVTNAISAAINGIKATDIVKASAEISVAEDGTLGVKAIGVDKLVNVEGFELILNGGNADLTA